MSKESQSSFTDGGGVALPQPTFIVFSLLASAAAAQDTNQQRPMLSRKKGKEKEEKIVKKEKIPCYWSLSSVPFAFWGEGSVGRAVKFYGASYCENL